MGRDSPRTDRSFTLTNARLLDGTGARPREPVTIGIADGRIAHVSEGPGGDEAVDLGGRTVLPGLVDAHIHLSSDVARSPGFGPPARAQGRTASTAGAGLVS